MKIAVTGASGQLGAAIARAAITLLGADNVVGLARTPANAPALGVEIRAGDYDDRGQLTSSFEGIDAVLIVSGNTKPEDRIGQHRNVIEAAKAAGVRKIVYTSVGGAESGTAFSPVVASNRQTEQDVRDSGLECSIGRNGIYIEPDVEFIETYRKEGRIRNSAGDGRCGYTTRSELAYAYARMVTQDQHNGQTYQLHGEPITQYQLAEYLNRAFGTDLVYEPVGVDAYRKERTKELGQFLGTIISGIYEGIRSGVFDIPSDFEKAAGRPHQTWDDYFDSLKVG